MTEVKVLIEGIAEIKKDGSWRATSSTTLVKTNTGKKIIVDPGCDRELLLKKLKEEKLTIEDIDIVFLTHYHLDHSLLCGIFPNAMVVDHELWQKGPDGDEHKGVVPGTEIKIILTPGHSPEHASLLVKTDLGNILVGGDIIWWAKGEEEIWDFNKKDEFASDQAAVVKSREKVEKIADFIIPGHGKMFKVRK